MKCNICSRELKRIWIDDYFYLKCDCMKVVVTKEKDDPICLRASIGGDDNLGYYIVYRGEEQKVIKMLTETLEALKNTIK